MFGRLNCGCLKFFFTFVHQIIIVIETKYIDPKLRALNECTSGKCLMPLKCVLVGVWRK